MEDGQWGDPSLNICWLVFCSLRNTLLILHRRDEAVCLHHDQCSCVLVTAAAPQPPQKASLEAFRSVRGDRLFSMCVPRESHIIKLKSYVRIL